MFDLEKALRKAVDRGVNEAMQRSRRPVFTVSADYIRDEEEYWDGRWSGAEYTNEESAKAAADEFVDSLRDEDELIVVWVYGGEWKNPDGDVFGEPVAIYSASNKNEEETSRIMSEAGFVNTKCDRYID